MAQSKVTDRVTIFFYEDMMADQLLLEALNLLSSPRMRSNKIKEWAYEYIKNNEDIINEINKFKRLNQLKNTKSEETATESIEEILDKPQQNNTEKKKKIKSKLNIVTS